MSSLKLFKVTWEQHSWEDYICFVVFATSEEEARNTHPEGFSTTEWDVGRGRVVDEGGDYEMDTESNWIAFKDRHLLVVEECEAKPGIVMTSFNYA